MYLKTAGLNIIFLVSCAISLSLENGPYFRGSKIRISFIKIIKTCLTYLLPSPYLKDIPIK